MCGAEKITSSRRLERSEDRRREFTYWYSIGIFRKKIYWFWEFLNRRQINSDHMIYGRDLKRWRMYFEYKKCNIMLLLYSLLSRTIFFFLSITWKKGKNFYCCTRFKTIQRKPLKWWYKSTSNDQILWFLVVKSLVGNLYY